MLELPVRSIVILSIPSPQPAVGGSPCLHSHIVSASLLLFGPATGTGGVGLSVVGRGVCAVGLELGTITARVLGGERGKRSAVVRGPRQDFTHSYSEGSRYAD